MKKLYSVTAVIGILLFGGIPASADEATSLELYVPKQNQEEESVDRTADSQSGVVTGTVAPKTKDLMERTVPLLFVLIFGSAGSVIIWHRIHTTSEESHH